MRWARWAALAILLSFGVAEVSAQPAPIPSYVFVRESSGHVWLVYPNGIRVAVPIHPATDDEIAAHPWLGVYAVPKDDHTGLRWGNRPDWAVDPPHR